MTTEQRQQQNRTDGPHVLPTTSAGPPVRHDPAERLAELFRLLADGQEWSAKRLSERLAVTARTIRRDMQLLKRKGLATQSRGGHGSYRLVLESFCQTPLLNVREVLALLVMAGGHSVADECGQALETVVKIVTLQPQRLREPLVALANLIRSQSADARQWLCRQCWLPVVLEGLLGPRPLKIWLTAASPQDWLMPLEIVPSALALRGTQWTLRAAQVSKVQGEITLDLSHVEKVEFVGCDG